ncbi:MAG: DUF2909 domain-containing protein [Gammaproteobacteria bacterium]|nr:DUF2909 domain-containing protein [Gammaproteobacteria bacterium]
MWFKVLIIINLLLILISLFSGAFFLTKQKQSNKLLGALKVRVALSVLLVCLLIFGFYSGQIAPHGL